MLNTCDAFEMINKICDRAGYPKFTDWQVKTTRQGNFTIVHVQFIYKSMSYDGYGASKRFPSDEESLVGEQLATYRAVENVMESIRERFINDMVVIKAAKLNQLETDEPDRWRK